MNEAEDFKDDVIYHYCTEHVFDSIIANKKIWLSDIFKMNDSSELVWARDLFVKVLKENRDLFKQEFRFYIIHSVFSPDEYVLPLIGCFSKNGDLLSQWRAYANDASGISIGFSASLIYAGLGVNMRPVTYDKSIQYEEILSKLVRLHQFWIEENENYEKIDFFAKGFAVDLNYYKNPAFFEEREVRIVRLVVKDFEKDFYVDVGGNSELKTISPLEIKIRERAGEKITYIELPIDIPGYQIIKEVILGPKCKIDHEEVVEKLKTVGLSEVEIKKSTITYR